MSSASDAQQFSPSVARNRGPILDVLKRVLPQKGLVFEVASGTGEHAIHFARHLPGPDLAAERPRRRRARLDRRLDRGGASAEYPRAAGLRRHVGVMAGRARRRRGVHQHDPHLAVDRDGGAAARRRAHPSRGRRALPVRAVQAGRTPHGAQQRGVRPRPPPAQPCVGRAGPRRRSKRPHPPMGYASTHTVEMPANNLSVIFAR